MSKILEVTKQDVGRKVACNFAEYIVTDVDDFGMCFLYSLGVGKINAAYDLTKGGFRWLTERKIKSKIPKRLKGPKKPKQTSCSLTIMYGRDVCISSYTIKNVNEIELDDRNYLHIHSNVKSEGGVFSGKVSRIHLLEEEVCDIYISTPDGNINFTALQDDEVSPNATFAIEDYRNKKYNYVIAKEFNFLL